MRLPRFGGPPERDYAQKGPIRSDPLESGQLE